MGYLKKNRDAGKKRDILASSDPKPEEEKGTGTDAEGAEIFEDFDKEKDKVQEWWLQKGVEEAVEEEPKEEEKEWGEEKEAENEEDKDDLIYSLREEEEKEEMDMALKTAMDEMGDVSAEELLELGKTALHEMGELRVERE